MYIRKENRVIIPENILLTPLWLNRELQIPIKRARKEKGISIVNDVIDKNRRL